MESSFFLKTILGFSEDKLEKFINDPNSKKIKGTNSELLQTVAQIYHTCLSLGINQGISQKYLIEFYKSGGNENKSEFIKKMILIDKIYLSAEIKGIPLNRIEQVVFENYNNTSMIKEILAKLEKSTYDFNDLGIKDNSTITTANKNAKFGFNFVLDSNIATGKYIDNYIEENKEKIEYPGSFFYDTRKIIEMYVNEFYKDSIINGEEVYYKRTINENALEKDIVDYAKKRCVPLEEIIEWMKTKIYTHFIFEKGKDVDDKTKEEERKNLNLSREEQELVEKIVNSKVTDIVLGNVAINDLVDEIIENKDKSDFDNDDDRR